MNILKTQHALNMCFLDQLISVFCIRNTDTKENVDKVVLSTKADISLPSVSDFKQALSFLNDRDRIFISLQIGENDAITYTNDPDTFIEDCASALKIRDIEPISFSIKIEKRKKENKISIYSLDSFVEYLNSLQILDVFSVFKDICNSTSGFVFFELQNKKQLCFYTKTIQFASREDGIKVLDITEIRNTRREEIKNICHTNLINKYAFLPEDFHEISNSEHKELSLIFKRLSLLTSISYLFDIVQIDNMCIYYKLNGYKAINGHVNLQDLDITSEGEYYKIYEWGYCDGNIVDKVGLARNIVSLHLSQFDNIVLGGNPFYSILSSFEIYRKQNIKQYIEIRNKISDNLLDFKNKADKIVEDFASDFKKSLFTFVSFFASVIIIQVLRNGNFIGVFTIDVTILSITFLLIMILILFASNWEIQTQKKRYNKTYQNMKDRYQDLLNEDDIRRILNNDKDYNANIGFIERKRKMISYLWCGSVVVLFISISVLYLINKYS